MFVSLCVLVSSICMTDSDIELIDAYPIMEPLFVQGLELDEEGRLLLSTGLYGDSRIGYLDVENGEFTEVDRLDATLFGEGITITPDSVLQLTWKAETLFARNPETLEVIDTIEYEGEGWGLAYDDMRDAVWMSNGSATVLLRDLETFEVIEEIETDFNNINELEYVDGFLYANIWLTYDIIKIDVENGEVVNRYDLEPIIYSVDIDEAELEAMDTLNGIAHIDGDVFYLTGKNYPYLYEVILR